MTLLGKLLVFLNVVLSFVMLAWADRAVYTNRIDWSTPRPSPATSPPASSTPARLAWWTRWRRRPGQRPLARGGERQRRQGQSPAPATACSRGRSAAPTTASLVCRRAQCGRHGPDGKGEKVVVKRVADERRPTRPRPRQRQPADPGRRRAPQDPEDPSGEPLYCYDWYVKELARLTPRSRRRRPSSRSWRRKRKP